MEMKNALGRLFVVLPTYGKYFVHGKTNKFLIERLLCLWGNVKERFHLTDELKSVFRGMRQLDEI